MESINIEPFKIIGISVRTTNENDQSEKDIGALWNKLMSEDILSQIPNKVNNNIYSLYTAYESDHTKPYTTILGCKVKTLDAIPEGMIGQSFEGGNYVRITAKGDLTKGLIADEWRKIWALELDRLFTADFELHDAKNQDPTNAEVAFLVAIK